MIQVLQRAATVLEVLADGPATFTHIQERVSLHKATLSNILRSLMELRFICKQADGRYTVGDGIVDLARARMRLATLAGLAEHWARETAQEAGELVVIATLCNGERFNLAKASPGRSVIVDSGMHQKLSPFDTATGRALVAFASESALADVIKLHGIGSKDWPEIRRRSDLDRELRKIREAGVAQYSWIDGEVHTLAVPVMGADDTAWAAIGAAVPAYRFSNQHRRIVLKTLTTASERMGKELSLLCTETTE